MDSIHISHLPLNPDTLTLCPRFRTIPHTSAEVSMDRKFWIAFVVILVVKVVWETLVHGVLLAADYAESAQLWRPPEEMKNGLMLVVHIASAFFFTLIFTVGTRDGASRKG